MYKKLKTFLTTNQFPEWNPLSEISWWNLFWTIIIVLLLVILVAYI